MTQTKTPNPVYLRENGQTVEMYLPSGDVVLLDRPDYTDEIRMARWSGTGGPNRRYAANTTITDDGRRILTPLHRLVTRARKGDRVVFRNHNRFDLRRVNLVLIRAFDEAEAEVAR